MLGYNYAITPMEVSSKLELDDNGETVNDRIRIFQSLSIIISVIICNYFY
jgi:hypothetical protein